MRPSSFSRTFQYLSQRAALGMAAILLVGLLAACGGNDDGDPTPTPPEATATTESVLVATPDEIAPSEEEPIAPTEDESTPLASIATPEVVATPVTAVPADQNTSPGAGDESVASPSLLTPLSRDEFESELLAAFPMSEAESEGGTIILGEATDISTVNGLLTNDAPTLYITGAIFESLIGVSPIDGRPVPGLADNWDVSEDGLVYTFHLNRDAKWHDGVDFTAEDVEFTFDIALDPNTGYFYRSIVSEAIESYRVIDEHTFEITARDRLVTFLYEGPGAVLIMPKHIWEDVGPESWSFDAGSTGQDPSRVIGTGPFEFQEWIQGDRVTIVRNDDYYEKVPNIEALTLRVLPNADASVIALQQAEIDIMEIIPPAQMEAVQADEDLDVDIYDFFQFTYYAFNLDPQRTTLFQDKEVRQALFTALDRDSITQSIFLGYGEAAVGTQPPLSPAYAPDQLTPQYEFDPDRARELLAEAGWTDSSDNGTVDRDGEELRFDLLYAGGDSVVEQIVAYMQEAWNAIGVRMEPRSVSGAALLDGLEAHDFDVALLAVSLTPDGSQSALFSCEAASFGLNFSSYCSEEWDQLDERQKREFDPSARTNMLIQQSQIIWEDQPVGVLRFGVARTGYSTALQNFYPNGYGFLWSLPYVWIDEGSGGT